MKKMIVSAMIGLALPGAAFAATISLEDTLGDPSKVLVAAGSTGTVTVNVNVANVTDMAGLDFRIYSLDTPGYNPIGPVDNTTFTITGRVIGSTGITDFSNTNASVTSTGHNGATSLGQDNALNQVNDRNLGASSDFSPENSVNGSATIMTLTIQFSGLAPNSDYRIQITGDNDIAGASAPSWSTSEFGSASFDLGAAYVIATPEPTSALLVLLGSLGLMLPRRRVA